MLVVEISSCVKNGLHDGVVWYAKFLSLNGPNLVGSVTLNLILDALILVGLICADVVVILVAPGTIELGIVTTGIAAYPFALVIPFEI